MSNILKPLKYPSQTPTQIISIVLLKSVTGKPVWSTAPLSPTIIQRQNPLSTSFFQKPENQPFKPSFRPSWHEAFTPKEPAIIRTFSLLSKSFLLIPGIFLQIPVFTVFGQQFFMRTFFDDFTFFYYQNLICIDNR